MALHESSGPASPGTRLEAPSPLLNVRGLSAGYGRKQVIFDVDLVIQPGEVVAMLGHNGAGKTTTLRTIFGMVPARGGQLQFANEDITANLTPTRNVRRGMATIPAERFVFGDLTVADNLRLGALHYRGDLGARLDYVQELFPILRERASQLAGTMSGGQQRMLSLGLALMSEPRLLLLDEPSLGLAPAVVQSIFDTIRDLSSQHGMGVLLLEQNVNQALRVADRVVILRAGRVILEESSAQMRARDPSEWWTLF